MSTKPSLDELRQQVDTIDDKIHDLIMERTRVVENVRAIKKADRVKIRPAREDQIICRLIKRHKGFFPKWELVRIWREIIVATLRFEGPFSTIIYTGDDDADGYWDLARDQYGSFTPLTTSGSFHQVIEAVRNQEATVGILPVPRPGDENPWWRHLVTESADAPRVIARLPFFGQGNARAGGIEALVVCPVGREPTGRDRSYLAFETAAETSPGRLRDVVSAEGFEILFQDKWTDPHLPGLTLHLMEVDGFITVGDPRLRCCQDTLGTSENRVFPLGNYALPLSTDELEN